jgi:O-antigen/teichoic acid export membrane protein
LSLLGVAGGVLLATAGDRLVVLLFEDAFAESGEIARWMSLVLVVQFLGTPYWRLLYAANRERTVLWLQAASLALNIGLNALLIPRWGAFGALWASVASETFIVGVFHWKVSAMIPAPYGPKALRLAIAASGALAIGLWTRGLTAWPTAGALALVSFAGFAAGLGLLRLGDLEGRSGGRLLRRPRAPR